MTRLPKPLSIYRAARGYRDDTSYGAFVAACKAAGPRNLVQELLDPFAIMLDPPADVRAALDGFKARPWYSAAELSRLWPLVCIGLAGGKQGNKPAPEQVALRLAQEGLPRLKQWDGSTTFLHNGKRQEFFIVQDVWKIASLRWTQQDFDRSMSL
jgi:hypothetical protein